MINKNIFINREDEVKALREIFGSGKAELVLIYGRRRIGKTTLVLYASKGFDKIYLYVDYANPSILLKRFSRTLLKSLDLPEGIIVEDFETLFKLFPKAGIVVLDEFQRLQEVDPSIVTTLQKVWDLELSRSRVKLVIVGSSVGLMERIGLSPSAPLFGRVTRVIELKELYYRDIRAFYPGSSEEERVGYYAVLGGVPAYHQIFDEKLGFIENIKRNILDKTSPLYSEVERLLREETRDPATYMSILAAISHGKNTFSEIADYASIEKSSLSKYLQVLRNNLRLIKVIQALETTGKRFRRYIITSNFFRFWFRYIYPYGSLLEEGEVDKVLEIANGFKPHISEAFEYICREHMYLLNKEKMVGFTKIGKWWLKDIEIDWIAIDEKSSTAYFVECKWTNKPIGREVLNRLIKKSEYFPWRKNRRKDKYILYSKSGFTWSEEDGDVIQISLKDMEKLFDKYMPLIREYP
ncbi:MAG: hypothetical protein DRJ47_03615 [Thermoprotei archaeon]|nr:MAG: hypothetical protein DRJ47_03615 [Thermoprotei archaeon]